MASNRDPLKDYRINKRGRKVTSSSTRSARSKKASAPKPTSSSTRSRGKGTGSKKVTTSQQRGNRMKQSTAKPTSGQGGTRAKVTTKARSTGLIGTRNTPATKTTYTGPKTPGVKFNPSNRVQRFSDNPQVKANVKALQSSPLGKFLKGGKVAGALAIGQAVKGALDSRKTKNKPDPKPKNSIGKYNTRDADGTVRSRKKVGPKKVGAKKVGTEAQNFDKAFAKARKAGKSTFTWQGKSYSTKMK